PRQIISLLLPTRASCRSGGYWPRRESCSAGWECHRSHDRRWAGDLRQATATAQGRIPSNLASRGTSQSRHAAPAYALIVREIETAAHAVGWRWHVRKTRNPGDFDTAFPAMTKARVNAISPPADSMFCQYRARLVRLTANTR